MGNNRGRDEFPEADDTVVLVVVAQGRFGIQDVSEGGE